mmetsp:Transcript_101392/g.140816  ORF Transcript_101392/g.140816 Transcript_101392/m.140816 type:complete len:253 (+) Transcript_101392:525-1283(+)
MAVCGRHCRKLAWKPSELRLETACCLLPATAALLRLCSVSQRSPRTEQAWKRSVRRPNRPCSKRWTPVISRRPWSQSARSARPRLLPSSSQDLSTSVPQLGPGSCRRSFRCKRLHSLNQLNKLSRSSRSALPQCQTGQRHRQGRWAARSGVSSELSFVYQPNLCLWIRSLLQRHPSRTVLGSWLVLLLLASAPRSRWLSTWMMIPVARDRAVVWFESRASRPCLKQWAAPSCTAWIHLKTTRLRRGQAPASS